jgi:dihydrofolate reductase (trimethoprim resistance protein)
MKLSLMVARSENGVIGNGPDIPWKAKGEQLLLKAMTFNQWILVGRKTFESMGVLPNRKYAVVTRSARVSSDENVLYFNSVESALARLQELTAHALVLGGGEVFKHLIHRADVIHQSIVHTTVNGDVFFPPIPQGFVKVFDQYFESNVNYTYEIWKRS